MGSLRRIASRSSAVKKTVWSADDMMVIDILMMVMGLERLIWNLWK